MSSPVVTRQNRRETATWLCQRAAWLLMLALISAVGGGEARGAVPAEARRGATLYRDSAYGEAADAFRQATIAAPDDPRWRYNLGLSEARNHDFESALNNLEATAHGQAGPIASDALYNAGNVHYANGKFAEAAQSYREALLRHPDDPDAKRNLELALRKLSQQQQQQKPDSSGQNKQKDQKQKNQDQQNKDQNQQKQDQQNQNDQNQSESQPQNDSTGQSEPRPDSTLTREQAERILKALADEEARLRDQAKHLQVLPAPGGKDW